MKLHDVAVSLVRRWYLSLAALLLTTGLVGLAFMLVPPTYETKASVVLLPPKATVAAGANPYLQLANLGPTLDLLSVALSDQATAQAIQLVSRTAEYTAKPDPTSSAPILVLTVDDRTAGGAQAVMSRLLVELPNELTTLQGDLGVTARASITPAVVAADSEALKVGKDQWRAAVVAAGAGLVGGALLIALWDGRRLRSAQPEAAAKGATVEALDGGAEGRPRYRPASKRLRLSGGNPATPPHAPDWTWEPKDGTETSGRGA